MKLGMWSGIGVGLSIGVNTKSSAQADKTGPSMSLTISGISGSVAAFSVVASEQVVGFVSGDIVVSSGTISNFSTVDNITFLGDWNLPTGTISTIDVPAGICTDIAGNPNTAATQVSAGYRVSYLASKDNFLASPTPTRNNGASAVLGYGTASYPWIMQFDVSAVSSLATCVEAVLELYQAASGGAAAFTTTIYSILSGNAGWVEGTTDNNTAKARESCWNAKAADGSGGVTTAWAGSAGLATSGVDYNAVSIGSFSGNASDAVGTLYSISLTASVVRNWFGASNANYGIKATHNNNAGSLGSRTNTTVGYRPRLLLTFFN